MQAQQLAAVDQRSDEMETPAEVIPLFRGRQQAEHPLVTLGNATWRKPDVAGYLGVSIRTVDRWMAERELPFEKPFGSAVFFYPQKVMGWWSAQCANGAGA